MKKKIINENKDINIEYEKNEKEDDNFSFKEGANNVSEEEKNEKTIDNENKLEIGLIQTPRFKNNNKTNRIEEDKNKKMPINNIINYNDKYNKVDLNDSFQNNSMNLGHININNNDNKFNTQIKEKFSNERFTIYKSIQKSKDNIIRITTYKKTRKKKNNDESNISGENKKNDKNNVRTEPKDNNNMNSKQINSTSPNDLLKYDLFNDSKNYFKLNLNRTTKPSKSVRTKELSNFLLKEYSDTISDKVPRSKKLYEESNINTENKKNNKFIFNIKKDDKGKKEEEKIIAIKEENNDNLTYVSKNDVDLEDYVYNPFRNCYAKIRKF